MSCCFKHDTMLKVQLKFYFTKKKSFILSLLKKWTFYFHYWYIINKIILICDHERCDSVEIIKVGFYCLTAFILRWKCCVCHLFELIFSLYSSFCLWRLVLLPFLLSSVCVHLGTLSFCLQFYFVSRDLYAWIIAIRCQEIFLS